MLLTSGRYKMKLTTRFLFSLNILLLLKLYPYVYISYTYPTPTNHHPPTSSFSLFPPLPPFLSFKLQKMPSSFQPLPASPTPESPVKFSCRISGVPPLPCVVSVTPSIVLLQVKKGGKLHVKLRAPTTEINFDFHPRKSSLHPPRVHLTHLPTSKQYALTFPRRPAGPEESATALVRLHKWNCFTALKVPTGGPGLVMDVRSPSRASDLRPLSYGGVGSARTPSPPRHRRALTAPSTAPEARRRSRAPPKAVAAVLHTITHPPLPPPPPPPAP